MSRGLGRRQRELLERLEGGPFWLADLVEPGHDAASTRRYEAEYQALYRALRSLEEHGLATSQIYEQGRARVLVQRSGDTAPALRPRRARSSVSV